MNESNSYNPFESPKPFFTEIYDAGSRLEETHNDITVRTDVIDDYNPFPDNKIVIDTDINMFSEASNATANFTNWQTAAEANLGVEKNHDTIVEAALNAFAKTKNFPPFPNCCLLKPCFYQDIDVEIPDRCRFIVKLGYIIWICYCLALLINLVGALTVMITFTGVSGFSGNISTLLGISFLILFLFVPLSYIFWFRRLYCACKNDSSSQFFIFFFMFSAYLISLLVEIIGIPQCGVCGWILVVLTKDNKGVMVFMAVIATIFTLLTFASCYLFIKVNVYFRSSGGSYVKAKNELTSDSSSGITIKSAFIGIFRSK